MTAPTPRPPADPDDPRVQMNVRLPLTLRGRIDERRATVDPPISRDVWVERALSYVLDNTTPSRPEARPLRGPGRRTAPPPRLRPGHNPTAPPCKVKDAHPPHGGMAVPFCPGVTDQF